MSSDHPSRPLPQTPWAVAVVLVPIACAILYFAWQGGDFPTGPVEPEAGWRPQQPSARWTCIVVHHSASDLGGAERFDEWHRKKGWDELGYHFVIGNGTDTPDGAVEIGPRWAEQKHGAHCLTDDGYYNQHGIGICLVGNLDEHPPTPAQMRSLARLVRFLCTEFRIPVRKVTTHGRVTGKTDCPGKDFNLDRLRAMVRG
jgi:N-acetyl-anhydromuramyl-L-alanine amidase AmpD